MPKRRQPSLKRSEPKGPSSRDYVATETKSESPTATEDSATPAVSGRWRAVYSLLPPIIALLTSANSLSNYFAADDLEQVFDNTFIKKLSNLPAAFSTSVWSFNYADVVFTIDPYFRPVFSSLFSVNYALFGTSPMGWHLVSVLIHVVVTFMVFAVAKEITGRNWVALLTGALFAVHPVHSESVAWVSGVTDPLMVLLLLPAFYCYLRFRRRGGKYLLGLALSFFLLALLSKETAVALCAVVAYCELFHFKVDEAFRERLVRALRMLALFAIPIAIYISMRYYVLGSLLFSSEPRYPLVPSLLTVPLATMKYLGLMLIPWGYSYQHYTALVETALSASFLAPLGLVIGVAVCVALVKSREFRLAAAWFAAMLAPALFALRQFEPANLVQEKYLYAPSFGICLALALGIEALAMRPRFGTRGRAAAVAVGAVLVIVWGAIFIRQNRIWDDTVTVYENSVATSPRTPIAHASLSRSYYEAGRPREAEAASRAALDLDPACGPAYLNLSSYARMSGKLEKACEYLEEGISAVPEGLMTRHDLATMYLNLGLLYGQRKMFELGEQKLLRSIEISPRAVAWYYTGQFYFDQGRFDDARAMYEQALAHVPRWFAPIHLRLGLTYEAQGDISRAETEFEKYLELAPPDAPDRENVKKHLPALKGAPPTSK